MSESRGPLEELFARSALRALESQRPTPGAVLADRYELIAELGSGGSGVVYRALDRKESVEVAVKVLIARSASWQKRFAREVRALQQLNHRHIVAVRGNGTHTRADGTSMAYLVMEYVPEVRSLRSLMDEPWSLREKISFGQKVALALGHAHDRSIVHRDVKPENVLVDADHEPLVIDFGLARQADSDDPTVSGTGERPGTPAYMSPEQHGRADPGPASDVFSLGVLLHEWLHGDPPFEKPPERLEDFERIAVRRGPDPRDRDVASILCVALSPIPEDRYPDGRALAVDLERLLLGRSPKARGMLARATARRVARRAALPVSAILLVGVGTGVAAWGWKESVRASEANESLRSGVSGSTDTFARLLEQSHVVFTLGRIEPLANGEAIEATVVELENDLRSHDATRGEMPDDREVALARAIAAIWRGDTERAKGLLSAPLLADGWSAPDPAFAIRLHGVHVMNLRTMGRPEDILEMAYEPPPDHPHAWRVAGQRSLALIDMGRHEEALEEVEQALFFCGNDSLARALLLTRRGVALRRLGRTEECAAAFGEAIDLDPRQATALANLGALRAEQGDFEQAVPLMERARVETPRDKMLLKNLASIYSQQKRPRLAIEAAKAALRVDPNYADAYLLLAYGHRELGGIDVALEAARMARQIAPRSTEFLYLEADLVARTNPRQALDLLDRAIRIGSDPRYHQRSGWIHAVLLDDPQGALRCYESGLEEHPGNSDLLLERSYSLLDLGRNEESLTVVEQVVRERPKDVLAHVQLAQMLLVLDRDPALAEEHIAVALSIDPHNAEAWRVRTEAQGRLGNQPEAYHSACRWHELAPEDPTAGQAVLENRSRLLDAQ